MTNVPTDLQLTEHLNRIDFTLERIAHALEALAKKDISDFKPLERKPLSQR
jgi:hypothetical protein